jgi:DNA excision repair protein ERCC-2
MDLFPYVHIGDQGPLVAFISDSVTKGCSAVLESGTGTGKTVCSIVGALEASLGSGRKTVFLTRTKSQQRQVLRELRAISSKERVFGMAVQGRSASNCPMMAEDPELAIGTSEELSRLCSEYKKEKDGVCGCSHYGNMASADLGALLEYCRDFMPDPEAFSSHCMDLGICPYEAAKLMLPQADLVTAPYSFVLMPRILRHFLDWLGAPLGEIVIIADEAHNLPEYLREVMTHEYTMGALDLCEREAGEWDDPELRDGLSVSDLTSAMGECMAEAAREYVIEDDGILPPNFLEDEMMYRLGASSLALGSMYRKLTELGAMVSDHKRSLRKLPRSYMGSLGRFLLEWTSAEDDIYVKLVTGGKNPGFLSYCLDPAPAAEPFRSCHSSIHMSGTLEPLSEYAEELGLDYAVCRRFESPYPKENLLVLRTDDVSTRFSDMHADPDNVRRIQEYLVGVVGSVHRSTAVFFPSYGMMDRFLEDGIPERLGRDIVFERRGMPHSDLMDCVERFRSSPGSVIFAVAGGRVSEGLDFPGKDLELAVLVGMPYPRPTARQEALVRYYDYRFGRGWDRAVATPTERRMRQAIGRLIRSGTDRGAAVILDGRVASAKGIASVPTSDPSGEVERFFSRG